MSSTHYNTFGTPEAGTPRVVKGFFLGYPAYYFGTSDFCATTTSTILACSPDSVVVQFILTTPTTIFVRVQRASGVARSESLGDLASAYFGGHGSYDDACFNMKLADLPRLIEGKMKWAACINTDALDLGLKEGSPDYFKRNTAGKPGNYFHTALSKALSTKITLQDRGYCETDATQLQLLPYITIKDAYSDDVLAYQRPYSGGEPRLHAKWSIGWGGHPDTPVGANQNWQEYLIQNAMRELFEEVPFNFDVVRGDAGTLAPKSTVGDLLAGALRNQLIIKRDYTIIRRREGVDNVHLGINITIEIPRDWIKLEDNAEAQKLKWIPSLLPENTLNDPDAKNYHNWENWSLHLFRAAARSMSGTDLITSPAE